MNYLAHLLLCAQRPLCRLGSMAGDFVKGRIDEHWHPHLRLGLLLHRRLDRFAHDQPACRRSRERLDPALRLYRGVLVDIYYDHFLARHWHRYSSQSLAAYAAGVYTDLERYAGLLPPAFSPLIPRIITHNWLLSYRDASFIPTVVERMAARPPGHPLLRHGGEELARHYDDLEVDFFAFMDAARSWLQKTQELRPDR